MGRVIKRAVECAAMLALIAVICAAATAARGPAGSIPADRDPTMSARTGASVHSPELSPPVGPRPDQLATATNDPRHVR